MIFNQFRYFKTYKYNSIENSAYEESHPNPEILPGTNTNNFAEAHAILYALKHAKEMNFQKVEIRTDSQYCINSLDKWINGWQKNGWKNSKGISIIHKVS